MRILFFIIILTIPFQQLFPQSNTSSNKSEFNNELKGIVIDSITGKPLMYANIYILHKNMGTVTNENGRFAIDTAGLTKNDTLRFGYLGYKTKKVAIGALDTLHTVVMQEKSYDLSETVIFGGNIDPEQIVKNIVKNLDSNYYKNYSVWETFIRERNFSDMKKLKLIYKKSTIEGLGKEVIQKLEQKTPKHTTGYRDFLGNLYFSKNPEDTLKIDPVKTVELKEKDIADLKQIEKIFNNLLIDTKDDEYWKIRTGILSSKVDIPDKDSIKKESVAGNHIKMKYFRRGIASTMKYSNLKNKDDWEFIYKTGKYYYKLSGGTRLNGEDIYIIDFKPKRGGLYTGRMYITSTSYALIKADYEYAPGKKGTDFHMFGVGYSENYFYGSIYFEKQNDKYLLKYFSTKAGTDIDFDRNIILMKKKKRFLFDKTLKEIKTGVKLSVSNEYSTEVLVINTKNISQKEYDDFSQPAYLDIIYVDRFDDSLWKGYSIIEPTKRMKEYKKQGK